MVIVLLALLVILCKVMGKSKNHVGKTIRHKLGINSDLKIFWKNCDFIKLTSYVRIQTSKHNWNKALPSQSSPNDGVRAIQSFTLAKSKIFCRGHSVANSQQNCVSGFHTVITFIVQMFSNPTASFKTAKGSLQTTETSKETFVFLNRHQKRWLYTSFINWKFDVQNKTS